MFDIVLLIVEGRMEMVGILYECVSGDVRSDEVRSDEVVLKVGGKVVFQG